MKLIEILIKPVAPLFVKTPTKYLLLYSYHDVPILLLKLFSFWDMDMFISFLNPSLYFKMLKASSFSFPSTTDLVAQSVIAWKSKILCVMTPVSSWMKNREDHGRSYNWKRDFTALKSVYAKLAYSVIMCVHVGEDGATVFQIKWGWRQ